jgi:hypothetical protein
MSATRVPRTFTDLTGTAAVNQGGTGATTAAAARSGLGLGTISTHDVADFVATGAAVTIPKDWDQLATDAHIALTSATHPNRRLYCGYVDSTNVGIIAAIDMDAGVNTPLYANCSYMSVSGQVQSQAGFYANTAASLAAGNGADILHHAQQGTGSDLPNFALAVHNYTDGGGVAVDCVGSGVGVSIRQAHNSTARADKPSNYIGTGQFLECRQIQGDYVTWVTKFTLDANACGVWNADWNDGLTTDAPIQLRSLTHPNRLLYAGYRDSLNVATIGSIDLDGGVFTPIAVRASTLSFTDGVIGLKVYTVATLPASPDAGSKAFVNDATGPTFLATLTGGGTVTCPVFFDGSAWRAG